MEMLLCAKPKNVTDKHPPKLVPVRLEVEDSMTGPIMDLSCHIEPSQGE